MCPKVSGDTPQCLRPGGANPPDGLNRYDTLSIGRSCLRMPSPVWVIVPQSLGWLSGLVPPGRLVVATQGAEESVKRGAQRMSESVPRLESADCAPLLDLDECPSGQAAAVRQLVIGPPVVRPQPREFQTQGLEVGVGREDRHLTIRRCRRLPCQCRPLPYFSCGIPAEGQSSALACARLQPGRGRHSE